MSSPFPSIDLDTLSGLKPLRRVVFSLGSNLGDSLDTLQGAVDALGATPDLIVTDVSHVYETDPVGVADQPNFLNLVVLAETTMPSMVLLERALAIEDAFMRVRAERWGPRTLDIDLILVGDRVRNDETLILPHPRAHERAFVLVPWLDVDPTAELPGYGRVADLVTHLDTSGVRLVPEAEVTLP